jgi:hypothetical protein
MPCSLCPHLLVGEKLCAPLTHERAGNRLTLTFDEEHYVYLHHKLWWVTDAEALERERVVLHTTSTVWTEGHLGVMTLEFVVHDVGT